MTLWGYKPLKLWGIFCIINTKQQQQQLTDIEGEQKPQ
jgi:hypothetical protein